MNLLLLLGIALLEPSSQQLPTPVEIRIPEYPEVAVKARMADVVEVEESISSDGAVATAVVIGKANPLLTAAALKAAREWRFAGDSGHATRKYVIRFEFTVDVDAAGKSECPVGPPSVSLLLPLQTVRIRAWLRPGPPTVNY